MLAVDAMLSDPSPGYYSKLLAVKPGCALDNPASLHDVRASFPVERRTRHSGLSTRLVFDLSASLRLTSVSAYRTSGLESLIETDISELDLSVTRVNDAQHQWSEELTLVHRQPRLTWIGGLFLFNEVDRRVFTFEAPASRPENRIECRVGADAGALFSQATIEISPRVAVTAGLRYTHERKTMDNNGRLSMLDPPMTLVPGAYRATPTRSLMTRGPRRSDPMCG